MSYLIFENATSADSRNQDEATRRGAGDARGDITRFWWMTREHPTNGQVLLVIPVEDQSSLTDEEHASLVETLPPDWTAESNINYSVA